MIALRGVIAAGAVAAMMVVCTTADPAVADPVEAGAPKPETFLFFTGADMWRYGAFFYGGTLWSPDGLDHDGFTGIR